MYRIAVIYILIDPRNNEPFYVGQTLNPRTRWLQHISNRNIISKRGTHTTFTQDRIIEICNDNMKPVMEIVDLSDEYSNARVTETRWIKALRSRGISLTNDKIPHAHGYASASIQEIKKIVNFLTLNL